MSMDSIKGGGGVQPQLFDPGVAGDAKPETVKKISTKGVELSVTTSRVPGDKAVAQALVQSMAMSMGLVSPKLLAPAELALLLKTMQSKVEQSMISMSKTDIERIQKEQKDTADVRLKKLEEQVEKANKAQKGGLIGKIFGWIAAAFMAIAGAILLATGVASATGAALLVGGIAMMTALALSEPDKDGNTPMSKIIGGIAKALGSIFNLDPKIAQGIATGLITALFVYAGSAAMLLNPAAGIAMMASLLPLLVTPDNLVKMGAPEELAQKLSLALTIGMAVTALAVTIGPALAKSAASAISSIAEKIATKVGPAIAEGTAKAGAEGAKVAKEATFIAKILCDQLGMTANKLAVIGKIGSAGADVIGGLATIGGGVAAGVSVKFADDANKARAEEKLLNAFLLKLTDQFQTEKDRLEEMIRRLMNFEPVAAMMESTHQAAAFVERHS